MPKPPIPDDSTFKESAPPVEKNPHLYIPQNFESRIPKEFREAAHDLAYYIKEQMGKAGFKENTYPVIDDVGPKDVTYIEMARDGLDAEELKQYPSAIIESRYRRTSDGAPIEEVGHIEFTTPRVGYSTGRYKFTLSSRLGWVFKENLEYPEFSERGTVDDVQDCRWIFDKTMEEFLPEEYRAVLCYNF